MGAAAETRAARHFRRVYDREEQARQLAEPRRYPGLHHLLASYSGMDPARLEPGSYRAVRDVTIAMMRGEVLHAGRLTGGRGLLMDWSVPGGQELLRDAPEAEIAIELVARCGALAVGTEED